MGYADMLGLFKGVGKGAGPGVEGAEAQGGVQGALRAAGGGMKGLGAGFMSSSPRLSRALQAQENAQYGSYRDMAMDQQAQDHAASRTAYGKQILNSLDALRQNLFGTNKAGTEIPGTPPEGVL